MSVKLSVPFVGERTISFR